ncbi:unnamed protein product, partial [Onchocerca flexuosa]|uniref:Uncharacterized protein n=1 Tax=Onchocerca flexuosa TaxID=387005 RepID=A0A183HSX3_9BILA
MRRNENLLNEMDNDTSDNESDSVRSEDLLNQNSNSDDDFEAVNIPDHDFEYFAEANESGYCSSDQLQEAIDRAFMDEFNEAMNRMELEVDEIESENWIHRNINNHYIPGNFHFN